MRSRTVEKLLGPGFILAVGIAAYAIFSGVSVSWPFPGGQTRSYAAPSHVRRDVVSTRHPRHHPQTRGIDDREDYGDQLRRSQGITGGHSPSPSAKPAAHRQVVDPARHMNWHQFHAWIQKPHGVP